MSRAVSTLILLLVLAGLAGFIFFADPGDAVDDQDYVFGAMGSDEIEVIEIRANDAVTRAERSGDDWMLVEPIQTKADSSELSVIGGAIATLTRQRTIDENAADLARYGLEEPNIEVGFRKKDEETFHRLLIGDRTPAGSELYARLPDEQHVFLVSSFLEQTFNKDTFALRDRTVLTFDRDAVEGLELASGNTTLQFARSDNDWRIVKPIAARADYGVVEGAVQRLGSGRMQSIVTEDADDLRTYGLDRPVATMTVQTSGGPATLTLGATENALMFAKDASRPIVFTVAPALRDDVIKDVSEFRRKDLFDARAFSTTRLELRRGDETLTLTKETGEESDVWRDGEGNEVDRAGVEQLLSSLTGLRATSFDAGTAAALRTPDLTATVSFGENQTETVSFARTDTGIAASRADEPGTARLDAASYDEAIAALEGLD